MDHSKFIVSNQKEESISAKRVNNQKGKREYGQEMSQSHRRYDEEETQDHR